MNPVEGESLTQQFNSNQILGTADYLAPEQALNLKTSTAASISTASGPPCTRC